MKHTFLNLKWFDIPREYGGVNGVTPMEEWGSYIIQNTQEKLKVYNVEDVEFVTYSPGAHLIPTVKVLCEDSLVKVGCQGVYRGDTARSGNLGTFITNRTANAARAMGCSSATIGHCEERRDKAGIPEEAGVTDEDAIGRLLNQEIKATIQAGPTVLYCIGETAGEQEHWQKVLESQLEAGPKGVDKEEAVVAYEPIRATGPGKTPPDKACITKTGTCIKEMIGGMDVVYGDGLKMNNARMLTSVPVMSGGPIALTRFQGQIGFYPEEYLKVVCAYLERG